MSRITRRTIVPVNQITPLTYRDGVTYIQMLTQLSEYIKGVLHPSLQHTVDQIVADVEAQMDTHHDQYVDGVQEFQRIHDAFMSDVNARLIALNDSAVSDLVGDATTLLRQSLENVFVSHVETNQRKIIATNPRYGTPYTLDSIYRALDHAESLGQGTVVEFPAGSYDVENGLDLSGYSVQIRGDGATGSITDDAGTTFYASTQNGPVMDFTDWIPPETFLGKAIHEGFRIVGSNEADYTKRNVGLRFALLMSTTFRDISINHTGGPCIYGSDDRPGYSVYLCDFERIVLHTPVNAGGNDVPYALFKGANGNRFRSLNLRSTERGNNLGKSGAVIFEAAGRHRTTANHVDSPWVEFIQVPSDSTIFHITDGSSNVISNPYFVDVTFEPDAENASYFTLDNTNLTTGDNGGNIVEGSVAGSNIRDEDSTRYGVKVLQNRNRVTGVRGYPGNNVYIGPDVIGSEITLGGAVSGDFGDAIVDESGNLSNTIIDDYSGNYRYGVHPTRDSYNHSVGGRVIAASTRYLSVSSGGEIVLDCSVADTFDVSLVGTESPRNMSIHNPYDGSILTLLIRQSGPTKQITWPENILWAGEPPILNSSGGTANTVVLKYSRNGWYEISRSITP